MFKVVYHRLVARDDIPKLSKEWKIKIRRAIEERLMTRPDFYGKPLRRSLKGYRKLRIGDYCVVFRIQGKKVFVVAIVHRSVVYNEVQKR